MPSLGEGGRCPTCSHENGADQRFCGECGAPLTIVCAACGAENDPIRKFCGRCGERIQSTAPRGLTATDRDAVTPHAAGERRQLTVLFCDLVGSTALSQQVDAEDWLDIIAEYQRVASAAVARFGGHVAKNLGDGLLVYFGWPTAWEDDPERAVRAGLAIVDSIADLNAKLEARGGTRLAVRVAMHTGLVVVADGGEVFGDTPNLAARAQAEAEPGTVVITSATQRLVAGMFVIEELGAKEIKGVREPIVLYRVLQPSGVRSRLDVAAGHLTRFVGRDVELATLVDRWERAADGEGQVVLITGEAGVGKSRLAYELRERLATIPHTWLEATATPYTESTPFHPVISAVGQGLSFTAHDSTAEKMEKIETALTRARLVSSEAVALVADFLGLAPPTPLEMAPDVQRRRTIELLAAWNLAMSETQPLVLLVEDLHWCDPSTLELFGRLIAQSATARVLLLGSTRPDFIPPWPARSNLTTIQLARLTKRQARTMAANLGAGALPEEMLETLVTRADGIPLYIEELTKAVVEPGVVRGIEAIPPTLADSLMARLDRLSATKEVAQQAAVLGREFPYALLAALGGLEEATLRQGLDRLVDAEILYARGVPPLSTYTFKHALVQEAAYGSLLKRTRQQLHGRVVDVLRECFPERAAAEPEVVGRHAQAAGRIDDAIASYGLAGQQAQARSAHAEAIGQFRKAIALLETATPSVARDERELKLQLALGGSLIAVRGFGHGETKAAWERAATLAETTGDAAGLASAKAGLAIYYINRGEIRRGRAIYAELLAAAEARGDRQQTCIIHSYLTVADFCEGKPESSLAHSERALSLYDPVQYHRVVRDPGVVAQIFGAWSLCLLGYPNRGLARAKEAVALARRLGHPFNLGLALGYETLIHWQRRDTVAQGASAMEMIALSEAHHLALWLGLGRAYHAMARVLNGEPDALPEMVEGLALSAETGNMTGAPGLMLMLAEAQRAAGQLDIAQSNVAAGFVIAAQTEQPCFDADLHRLDADLVLATGGTVEEALVRYHRALTVAREQGCRSFELRAAARLAGLLRDQGRPAEARALLAPVYGWFTEGFDTRDLIEAKALLDAVS